VVVLPWTEAAGQRRSELLQNLFSSMFIGKTDSFGSPSRPGGGRAGQRLRPPPAAAPRPRWFTADPFKALITHYKRRGTTKVKPAPESTLSI